MFWHKDHEAFTRALIKASMAEFAEHGSKAKKSRMRKRVTEARTVSYNRVIAQDKVDRPRASKAFNKDTAKKVVAGIENKVWAWMKSIHKQVSRSAALEVSPTDALLFPAAVLAKESRPGGQVDRRFMMLGGLAAGSALVMVPSVAEAGNPSIIKSILKGVTALLTRERAQTTKDYVSLGIRG